MINHLPKSLIESATSFIKRSKYPSAYVSFRDVQPIEHTPLSEEKYNDDEAAGWLAQRDNTRNSLNSINLDQTHTDDDKTHVYRYTASSTPLNKMLYAAHKNNTQHPMSFEISGRHNFTHDLHGIDAAVSRNKLKYELTTYSGISWHPHDKMDADNIVHLPAYTSTSTNKTIAHNFAKMHKTHRDVPVHVLKIRHPEGSSGMFTHNDTTISHFELEDEYIMPRKSTIRVNPVPEVHGNLHVWHSERINDHQPEVDTSYVSKTPGREEVYSNSKLKVFKTNSLAAYKEHYPSFHDIDQGKDFHADHVQQPIYHVHTPEAQVYQSGVSYDDSGDPETVFRNVSGRKAVVKQLVDKYPQIKHLEQLFQTKVTKGRE